MIHRCLISSLFLICLANAETFGFKTLDISSTNLKPWFPNKHEIQGRYYYEYGDGGGEIILKSFLGGGGGKKLLFYGVIFEPSPMLEKQNIKVLSSLSLKNHDLVGGREALKFYKFKFEKKEIKGLLYNNCFFEIYPNNNQ